VKPSPRFGTQRSHTSQQVSFHSDVIGYQRRGTAHTSGMSFAGKKTYELPRLPTARPVHPTVDVVCCALLRVLRKEKMRRAWVKHDRSFRMAIALLSCRRYSLLREATWWRAQRYHICLQPQWLFVHGTFATYTHKRQCRFFRGVLLSAGPRLMPRSSSALSVDVSTDPRTHMTIAAIWGTSCP